MSYRISPWPLLAAALLTDASALAQAPVFTGPCTRRTAIVLSEIMYHPAGEAAGEPSREFVELYNSGPVSEDLSGWSLRGDADFTLPPGTRLEAGQFLIIAADPAALVAAGATGTVLGPWSGHLPDDAGTVRLRKASGGIVLETSYQDHGPWPAAADGAGHSLVLARPSWGETRPEAWSASALPGGSPGTVDARTLTPDPPAALDRVVFSEILAAPATAGAGFAELFNPAATAVDLSGCRISADRDLPGTPLPAGTTVPAGGYLALTESAMGFPLDPSGGVLYLRAPDGLRVLQAQRWSGQDTGFPSGRPAPDAPGWRELATPTPGTANAAALERPAVISEIHYHPAAGDDAAEFVELHNRGTAAVDLSGWRLRDGISYTFPAGSSVAAGGYLVIARDRAHFLTIYPAVDPGVVLGDFSGALADGGERIALTFPRTGLVPGPGGPVEKTWQVTADEVTWSDGGRWPSRADGGGSTLQLTDVRADNSLAPSWSAPDESAEAVTVTVEHTGVLDLGHPKTTAATRFFLMLNGEGEALVDNVEVIAGGANRIANGDFTSGLNGWTRFGTHRPSVVENGALHVIATGGGDLANLIETPLTGTLAAGTSVTLRARVRWISGHPEILLGLNGGWLEAAATLPVPADAGTPGAASAGAGNAGPAITDVTHFPVLPQAGEAITITARIADPDHVASARVRYRLDPATSLQQVVMSDDGISQGDVRAGDGLFTARIPAQSAGSMLAFHVVAVDGAAPGMTSRFPADATARECLVRVGEATPAGTLGTYHLWLTRASHDEWRDRERSSNLDLDATFVSDGRVFYNCGTHYAGSQNGVTIYDSPTGNACGYNISLPADAVFLNTQKLTLDRETTRDATRQREQLMFWFLEKLGLPNLHRRYVHVYLNGVKRDQLIMEDVQKPDAEVMDEWFADKGRLTKMNPWFEFDAAGNVQTGSSLANRLEPFTTTGGALKLPRYRWTWSHAAGHDSAHDFSGISALITAAQAPAADLLSTMKARADIRQWMRTFAMNDLASFWDTFGNPGSKNAYLFESAGGRWSVVTWDMDVGLGVFNDPVDAPLFPANVDPAIARMYANPEMVRYYWQALDEALRTFFVSGPGTEIHRQLQEKYDALRANGAAVTSPFAASGAYGLSVPEWIAQRRAFLLAEAAAQDAAFSVVAPASSSAVLTTLTGRAPLAAQSIEVNGSPLTLTWTGVNRWSARVALTAGTNVLTITARDAAGAAIGTDSVTIQFIGTAQWPALRINEWMAANPGTTGITDPADGRADDWLELFNPAAAPVSLEGWYLSDDPADPLAYRIPAGFSLAAGGYQIIWADGEPEQTDRATRPDLHAPFKLGASGETLVLSAPDGTEIDRVVFGPQASGISRRRVPDGGPAIGYTLNATPGASNGPASASPLADTPSAAAAGGMLTIQWASLPGVVYEVETSPDLSTWTPAGAPVAGTGAPLSLSRPAAPEARLFLRIRTH